MLPLLTHNKVGERSIARHKRSHTTLDFVLNEAFVQLGFVEYLEGATSEPHAKIDERNHAEKGNEKRQWQRDDRRTKGLSSKPDFLVRQTQRRSISALVFREQRIVDRLERVTGRPGKSSSSSSAHRFSLNSSPNESRLRRRA